MIALHLPFQNVEQFWRGCLLATVSHAFGVARYPDLRNLHSWDVYAYCVQNNMAGRGAICFPAGPDEIPNCCAGGLWDPRSKRAGDPRSRKPDYWGMFDGVDEAARPLLDHSLGYLLEDAEGEAVPHVTTSLWGTTSSLKSPDTWDEFLLHGGHLIQRQFLPPDEALRAWQEEYALTNTEIGLVREIWTRRVAYPGQEVFLEAGELRALGVHGKRGLEQSGEVLNSINVWLYPPE